MSCDFCKGTGKHLCPDVAEPILIDCTKKGCPFIKSIKDEGRYVSSNDDFDKLVSEFNDEKGDNE